MIPAELTNLSQWICWRLEPDPKGGKPRKVPYGPKSGRKASVTSPDDRGTLAEAQAAKETYLFAGIGFVFTAGCGVIGVDIDHCIEQDGSLNEAATAILSKYPTYTEISPSGTGLHLFYRGTEMPATGNRNSKTSVEMYADARYFTMTGNQLTGSPDDIRDGAEALAWIHQTYIARKKAKKERGAENAVLPASPLTDAELLEKAKAAKNGDEFTALYEGRWEGTFGSQSEADLSLCCSLAFWSGKNVEQMDRLFRQSKLFRPKWDEVHSSDGMTYGQKTIALAMERTEKMYISPGSLGISEINGRYVRQRGNAISPITNFIVEPIELLETEDETQMTCDMVTIFGERFRQVLFTSDFSTVLRFKSVLNKRTISLSFSGSEGDLEMFKVYLSSLNWQRKKGVRASGLYERDGQWLFVDKAGAFSGDGQPVVDLVQVEHDSFISSTLPDHSAATADEIRRIGPCLVKYNEPAKAITVLAWISGCFVKEILRGAGIKYPHLYLIGEAGSGKSTTLERVIEPIFGVSRVIAAPQVTSFTLMKEASSSNLFPQILDEYKPSKIDKGRIAALSSHFRDSYDTHEGFRGRMNLTQVSYELLAPLVVAGEEAPEEPSIRERGLELMFSKVDLTDPVSMEAFRQITKEKQTLTKTGRLLLNTALTLSTETVTSWHTEAVSLFNEKFPTRVINNLACCFVGLRVLEAALQRISLTWRDVFPFSLETCAECLEKGAFEYLLDGRTSNKTVVEQTLEIMDRMGLTDEECKFIDKKQVALFFKGFYDRFTRYIRENAITAEYLQYGQFMKQLRKSELFLESKVVRFGQGGTKRAVLLDFEKMKEKCDVDGFLKSDVASL